MDNSFELPIDFNGKEYLFPGSLITYGYSYKIAITVFDTIINFEPDEEGQYRALIDPEAIKHNKDITRELLQAIAETLQEVL
ncbi:hypothetical protein [Ferruginibacter sp. SUN106]|uniref:hypothetical protein n=1 Tax=Ferruginibacter sp. SUN106 TaxID=2978348 RepID=UPI003D369B1E